MNVSPILTNYCVDRLINENNEKINTVINNYPLFNIFLPHLKSKVNTDNYKQKGEVLKKLRRIRKL